MDWPFTPYAPELAIRDSLPGLTPGSGSVLNTFLRHLVPAARCSHRTMINTSLMAACEVPGKRNTPLPSANTVKTHPHRESCRQIPLLPMLLGVSGGLVHRRLSALLAHHPRQPVSTPRRTTPDVVTPVRDETARGLSECIAAECKLFRSLP
ncbi:hypothetical protein TcCL_ESM09713 [Trypanosoma cruzi]|nr:hypothetical protein TcCL_ESM09713 [Trypanosoma cruzi]